MENNKIKRIIKLVLNDIAEIYLYFFGFYVICLILSHFFESWKLFFNWKAFHISIVVFGILSLLSERAKRIVFSKRNLKMVKIVRRLSEAIIGFLDRNKGAGFKILFKRFYELIRAIGVLVFGVIKILIGFFVARIKRLSPGQFLKIGTIIVVLAYFLQRGISVVNFFVLAYALISILFIVESRIAAAIALFFLASCPILLIYKKEGVAETMAIYAYYFLVITVVTQIREYMREDRTKAPQKLSTLDILDKLS